MGLENCEIILDNRWNTYYAGQTLNGQAKLTFNSPKKVRGILIQFLGEANTEWHDGKGPIEDESSILKGHEQYFHIKYYLLGGKNGPEIELPPGTHSYPFSCALPPTLPTSFESEFGHVRYTIKVTLDRPWKFDQDIKMAFTVIAPLDLNLNPRVRETFKLELEKTFCCFCCKSGILSLVTMIPVTAYVPGQTIPITWECLNSSGITVDSIKFELRKRVTFTATQPRVEKKEWKETIAQTTSGEVQSGVRRIVSENLYIPPLPPTFVLNCALISLDYELNVECVVSGLYGNLSGVIPLTLGTIPLTEKDDMDDPSMAPTQPVSPASPPNGQGGAIGWNVADSVGGKLYPNIPRPEFEETKYNADTILGRNDSEHTRVVGGTYAPRYPTCKINSFMNN